MSDLARMIEGINKHIQFAKQTAEDGWNARDDQTRAFHMQAALGGLEHVMRENERLVDALYKEESLKIKASKNKLT